MVDLVIQAKNNMDLPIKPFANNLWLWKCELPENEIDFSEIAKEVHEWKKAESDRLKYESWLKQEEEFKVSEWSPEFESLMRSHLIMGAYRYGKLAHTKEQQAEKKYYDYIGEIIKRAKLYLETGNKAYLVDIANSSMIEFVQEGNHPNPRFILEDDIVHFDLTLEK